MGTLASQAEIGALVQAPGRFRGIRVITSKNVDIVYAKSFRSHAFPLEMNPETNAVTSG